MRARTPRAIRRRGPVAPRIPPNLSRHTQTRPTDISTDPTPYPPLVETRPRGGPKWGVRGGPKMGVPGGPPREKKFQIVPTGRVIKYPKKCALFAPPARGGPRGGPRGPPGRAPGPPGTPPPGRGVPRGPPGEPSRAPRGWGGARKCPRPSSQPPGEVQMRAAALRLRADRPSPGPGESAGLDGTPWGEGRAARVDAGPRRPEKFSEVPGSRR